MNKVVIVGCVDSSISHAESLLIKNGMVRAIPSRMEKLGAKKIIETICLAHKVDANNFVNQVEVAPIWNNLLLDLVLANYEQKTWGWADSNAVHLLEYLKGQDENFFFVFVYDSPTVLLTHECFSYGSNFENSSRKWLNYNSALLEFYLKNKNRCLLVHSQQVESSDFHTMFDNMLSGRLVELKKQIRANGNKVKKIENKKVLDNDLNINNTKMFDYLSNEVVLQNIDLMELYSKIQDVANLPFLDKSNIEFTALDIWYNFITNKNMVENKKIEILNINKQLDELNLCLNKEKEKSLRQIYELEKQLEEKLVELINVKKDKEELNKVAIWRAGHIKELNRLKDELMLQVKKITEDNQKVNQVATWRENHIKELNKFNAELALQVKKLTDEYQKINKVAVWRADHIKELNQIKDELHKKNKALEKNSNGDEKDLLLSQIYMLQEEVEEYFIKNKQLQSILEGKGIDFMQYTSKFTSSGNKSLIGAVERIKQDRAYRLGAVLVENTKSFKGLVALPLALYKEIGHSSDDLPPLEEYADVEKIEKIKSHLSYRLGKVVTDVIDEPVKIFNSPAVLYKEVKAFKALRKGKK